MSYIQDGKLRWAGKLSEHSELKRTANLPWQVESWLPSEIKIEKKRPVNNSSQIMNKKGISWSLECYIQEDHKFFLMDASCILLNITARKKKTT